MLEFLAWIWSQAGKVYYWFGENFYWLLNFIFSIPFLIASTANTLIQSALANLRGLLDYIYGLALAAYNVAISYGNAIYQYINQRIQEAINFLQGVRQSIIDYVNNLIVTVRNGISSFVLTVRDNVILFLTGLLNELRTWVTNSFAWVLAIRDRILNLLALLTPQRITAIISFVTTWLQAVIAFFTNPLVFIFDIIQEKFISFLCYVIAWSLGTVKYDLPKKQAWKE